MTQPTTVRVAPPRVANEVLGFITAAAVLGFVFYFSIDFQDGSLGLRSEIERLAEGKPWNFIAVLISGMAVGALCGLYERTRSASVRAVATIKMTTWDYVIMAIEIAIIVATIVMLLLQIATMTLLFWIIAMLAVLVIPTIVRVRKDDGSNEQIVLTD